MYQELTKKVIEWKHARLNRIPSFLNITGGVIAGGAVSDAVYEFMHHEIGRTDYDIFISEQESSPKRIRVEYDDTKLDFVFKSRDIEDFDISVCQIGINIESNVVYVTPLFLYSYRTPVIVCRVSNLSVTDYIQHCWHETSPIIEQFETHVREHGTFCTFDICGSCRPDEDIVGVVEIDVLLHWFKRVNKYRCRFQKHQFVFVNNKKEDE